MTATAGELARHIATLWPWLPVCVDDSELWFSDNPSDQYEARALCADCPVRTMCAEAGADEPYVWGGLTAKQRNRPRRRRKGHDQRCQQCSRPFYPKTPNQKYCSEVCARDVRLVQHAASRRRQTLASSRRA